MKRIIIGIGISLLIGILILQLNFPLTKSSVFGTYISNEKEPFLAEMAHKADTLIFKSDGTYSS